MQPESWPPTAPQEPSVSFDPSNSHLPRFLVIRKSVSFSLPQGCWTRGAGRVDSVNHVPVWLPMTLLSATPNLFFLSTQVVVTSALCVWPALTQTPLIFGAQEMILLDPGNLLVIRTKILIGVPSKRKLSSFTASVSSLIHQKIPWRRMSGVSTIFR